MNRQELVEKIAAAEELPKAKAARVLQTVLDAVVETVKADEKLTLVGFGTFKLQARPAVRDAIRAPALRSRSPRPMCRSSSRAPLSRLLSTHRRRRLLPARRRPASNSVRGGNDPPV